jgi:acylpyruvate hydrolase
VRLATLRAGDGSRAVVLDGDAAVPVDGYADVGALLRAGDGALAQARAALDSGARVAYDEGDLLRPVLEPGAVVCVGLNYRTHILEMGRDLPEHPTLFSKLPRALTEPYADIVLPEISEKVDYEAELTIVIGRGGRDIPVAEAWDAVAGLTVMNDVSMRDFQRRTVQWFAGKTFEGCTPVGPAVVTPDELDDFGSREMRLTVNGEERQRAPLGDLVFDVPTLVADVSRIVTLRPGDLIATGTPGGVAAGMDPPRFLDDGDVVEVSIDGIGALRNTFRRTA